MACRRQAADLQSAYCLLLVFHGLRLGHHLRDGRRHLRHLLEADAGGRRRGWRDRDPGASQQEGHRRGEAQGNLPAGRPGRLRHRGLERVREHGSESESSGVAWHLGTRRHGHGLGLQPAGRRRRPDRVRGVHQRCHEMPWRGAGCGGRELDERVQDALTECEPAEEGGDGSRHARGQWNGLRAGRPPIHLAAPGHTLAQRRWACFLAGGRCGFRGARLTERPFDTGSRLWLH
mmetsp:Transcript_27414/g.77163  ORF Transcript_27414/g.77163 Transcript_27414/m.77163 type:complete len:233 (+) Transcript_27414:1087-1785(+)